MPSVVESGPSSETEISANAHLLQPRLAYHLLVTLIVATGPPARLRISDFEFWIYQPNSGVGFGFTMTSPHISPGFVTTAMRRRGQAGIRFPYEKKTGA